VLLLLVSLNFSLIHPHTHSQESFITLSTAITQVSALMNNVTLFTDN